MKPEFVRILKRAAIRPEARTNAIRILRNTIGKGAKHRYLLTAQRRTHSSARAVAPLANLPSVEDGARRSA